MRTVGRYEILREIGRGGMAIVYAARQPDLDRQVALKELSSFHANSAEFAHRFLRESRLAGSLNHPNIVTVHEYFEHEGTPYIAMELVPRGSLRPHVRRLSLAQVAGVLEGILAALAHAETAGIVHRDLKPENVMVTADGRVKITDFGIARATQRAGTHYVTATGMTVGTPTYMAPEQAMAGEVGPWTDLYSVGVLTYELMLGRPPFSDSDTPVAILMRHVNEPIPSAVTLEPTIDLGLSQWIDSPAGQGPAAAGSALAGRLGVARGDHRPSARTALAARGPVAGRSRRRRRGGPADAGAVREPRLDRDADAAPQRGVRGVHHVRSRAAAGGGRAGGGA